MTLFKNTFLIATASILATACADTVPDIPAEELYTRDFIKEFGIPDSTHDWSFATKVDVTVSLKNHNAGILRIYTDAYFVPGTEIIAGVELTGNTTAFPIDVRKGTRHLYARITDGENVILSGWYTIANGALNITDRNCSRAEGDNNPAISISELKGVLVDRMKADIISNLRNWKNESYNEAYPGDDTTSDDYMDYASEVPNLYLTNGGNLPANPTYGDEMSVKEALMLFGTYKGSDGSDAHGVFKEGEDNIAKYIRTGKLSHNALFKTIGAGEVTLDCIWRGVGGQADRFGYYYYDSNDAAYAANDGRPTPEQLWEMKKYVIIGNSDDHSSNIISAKSALTQRERFKIGENDDQITWENNEGLTSKWIMDEYYKLINGKEADPTVHINDMLRGAEIKLPYFGNDGNGEGTYTWPEEVTIGFFIYSIEDKSTSSGYNGGKRDKYRKFFFSNCENTYYLFNHAYGEMNPWLSSTQREEWATKYPTLEYGIDKRPYAATFKYGDKIFLSMADGGNDYDLNDLVFTLSNLKSDPEVELTPPEPDAEKLSWILACEDLGNTDDYDFNDIVLEISHIAGEEYITVTPLAAGGTLNSYIYVGDDNDVGNCRGEIHDLSGVQRGVAAGASAGTRPMGEVKPFTVATDKKWSITDGIKAFKIRTEYPDNSKPTGTWITFPNADDKYWNVPQMLLLPKGWEWPIERADIRDAYPDFLDWVANKETNEWINSKVNGLTHRRNQ